MENNILNQFYNEFEKVDSLNFNRKTDTLLEIQDNYNSINDNDLKLIKIERKVISLRFENGNLTHRFFENINGIQDFFKNDELEYLKNRIEDTNNNYLKIRYLMILWNCTNNRKYSIDVHKIISNILSNNLSFNKTYKLLLILKFITEKTKYNREYFLSNLPIIKLKISTSYDFFNFINLLNSNLVKSELLNELIIDYKNHINIDISYYFLNNQNYDLLKGLLQKAKIPLENLNSLMADNLDSLINNRDENDFVTLEKLREKAYYLKLAKRSKDYKETLEKLTQLKFTISLNKYQMSLSSETDKRLQLLGKYIKAKSDFLVSLDAKDIIEYFSKDYDNLHNVSTTKGNKPLFDNMFTTIVMDINNNTSNKESKKNTLSENIGLYYNLFFIPIFEQTLLKGIIKGKLTYNNFTDFFNSTWLGHPCQFSNGDIDIEETWLKQLQPGLYNFFSLFEFQIIHQQLKTNSYVLCIDSLTIKFEGIIRDLIRFLGGSTIKLKNNISEEILLEEMLEHEKIKEVFKESEIELFKYTFTKSGLNIRNNIAHGFYKSIDYNFNKISIILLCLFRISKFNIEK